METSEYMQIKEYFKKLKSEGKLTEEFLEEVAKNPKIIIERLKL